MASMATNEDFLETEELVSAGLERLDAGTP